MAGSALPQKLPMDLMQTQWAALLNPLLKSPLSSVVFLADVVLISGVTVVNHKLGRTMQGWFITDRNGPASVYRSSPMNGATLTLTSSAAVTVNLAVF